MSKQFKELIAEMVRDGRTVGQMVSDAPGVVVTKSRRLGDGVLEVSFTRDKVVPNALKNWAALPFGELLTHLPALTHRVTITIKSPETKGKDSQLTMPVADAMEIFGGEVPCDANFTRICRRFLDRKHHGPTPPPFEPAERSMTAQGQTKKPGSHSDGRHG